MHESEFRSAPSAADSVAILLTRAGQRVMRAVDAELAPFHISVTQYLVLSQAARYQRPSAGALARYADLDSGAMTRMLDRLAEMGLLERLHDPVDRRMVRLRITEHGRRTLVDLDGAIVRAQETIERIHGAADLDRFRACLQDIIGDTAVRKERA